MTDYEHKYQNNSWSAAGTGLGTGTVAGRSDRDRVPTIDSRSQHWTSDVHVHEPITPAYHTRYTHSHSHQRDNGSGSYDIHAHDTSASTSTGAYTSTSALRQRGHRGAGVSYSYSDFPPPHSPSSSSSSKLHGVGVGVASPLSSSSHPYTDRSRSPYPSSSPYSSSSQAHAHDSHLYSNSHSHSHSHSHSVTGYGNSSTLYNTYDRERDTYQHRDHRDRDHWDSATATATATGTFSSINTHSHLPHTSTSQSRPDAFASSGIGSDIDMSAWSFSSSTPDPFPSLFPWSAPATATALATTVESKLKVDQRRYADMLLERPTATATATATATSTAATTATSIQLQCAYTSGSVFGTDPKRWIQAHDQRVYRLWLANLKYWRITACAIWLMVLTTCVVYPITSVLTTGHILPTSFMGLLYVFLFGASNAVAAVIRGRTATVYGVLSSRWTAFISLLTHFHHLTILVGVAVPTAMAAYTYMMATDSPITASDSVSLLDDNSILLISGLGAFSIATAARVVISEENVLRFPSLHRGRVARIKSCVLRILRDGITSSVQFTLIWFLSFLLFRSWLVPVTVALYDVYIDQPPDVLMYRSSSSLSSSGHEPWLTVNLSTIAKLSYTCFVLDCCSRLARYMVNIFLTQSTWFGSMLLFGLNDHIDAYAKFLAYFSLSWSVTRSRATRAHLFGPLVYFAPQLAQILQQQQQPQQQQQQSTGVYASTVPAAHAHASSPHPTRTVGAGTDAVDATGASWNARPINVAAVPAWTTLFAIVGGDLSSFTNELQQLTSTSSGTSNTNTNINSKLSTSISRSNGVGAGSNLLSVPASASASTSTSASISTPVTASAWLSRVSTLISRKPLAMWAANVLCVLTCASLSEDTSGIVQGDLPQVLEILTTAQRTNQRVSDGGSSASASGSASGLIGPALALPLFPTGRSTSARASVTAGSWPWLWLWRSVATTRLIHLQRHAAHIQIHVSCCLYRVCSVLFGYFDSIPLTPQCAERLREYLTLGD